MTRQADKQQPITMGKLVKIFKPNFDGHQPLFPRIEGTGREGYVGSGVVDAFSEEERYYTGKLYAQDLFPPKLHYRH